MSDASTGDGMSSVLRVQHKIATDVDVLIVGGGPVGLSVAVQLGKAGISTLVAERRTSLSRHPKANGVFSRTMEAFRQWGMSREMAERGLPPSQCLGFVWTTRIAGEELGHIMFADDAERLRTEYARHSPELPCFIPQDLVERLLASKLNDQTNARLELGLEAIGITQNDIFATVEFRTVSGSSRHVRAKYVVAADGSRSTVRGLLGVAEEGVQPWGESVNIYFESPEFDQLRRGRPYQLWWVVNADVRGAFWPVSHAHRWIFTPEGIPGADAEFYTDEVCADLVRKGAGADVALKVISASIWHHEMAIAERWKIGRVFLAGDAAHRFPPHGGFGMNSGIQDAQNLGWKLIAVLRGDANPGLLDSYEAERKPVAVANAAQTMLNTELIKETGWFVPDPTELAIIELPEGEAIRSKIAAAVPMQRASIESLGQQFGAIYTSDAVVDDGSERKLSSVSEYVVSAAPGGRAPHVWLADANGATRSTIDLIGFDRFVLLTGEKNKTWQAAVKKIGSELKLEIPMFSIGGPSCDFRSEDFAGEFEVEATGAVLIRPDGYVGWRLRRMEGSPEAQLRAALNQILARATLGTSDEASVSEVSEGRARQ